MLLASVANWIGMGMLFFWPPNWRTRSADLASPRCVAVGFSRSTAPSVWESSFSGDDMPSIPPQPPGEGEPPQGEDAPLDGTLATFAGG
jgi:hypothetical protein